jgi:hypothetical protein
MQGSNFGFMMKTDSDGNPLWANLDTPDFLAKLVLMPLSKLQREIL